MRRRSRGSRRAPVITRIVSGAQTGVDRAALDVALELGIPCGGWVPLGRIDENGVIPARYPGLVETDSADWNERTEANVRDSDGTLIISRGPLTGGSRYTAEVARDLGRPLLHADLATPPLAAVAGSVRRWTEANSIGVLNVAGPRASKDPGLHPLVVELLKKVLSKS